MYRIVTEQRHTCDQQSIISGSTQLNFFRHFRLPALHSMPCICWFSTIGCNHPPQHLAERQKVLVEAPIHIRLRPLEETPCGDCFSCCPHECTWLLRLWFLALLIFRPRCLAMTMYVLGTMMNEVLLVVSDDRLIFPAISIQHSERRAAFHRNAWLTIRYSWGSSFLQM